MITETDREDSATAESNKTRDEALDVARRAEATVARLTKELAQSRNDERSSVQLCNRRLTELQSSQKELAEITEACGLLSTERAAREKAEMAYGNWKSIRHRYIEIEKSLRQKLERTERERDEAIAKLAQTPLTAEAVDELFAMRTSIAMTKGNFASLRAQLASVASERDEWANKASLRAGECSSLQNERDELQRKLAAAERVADVRLALLKEWKGNLAFECDLHKKTLAERDKLRGYYDEIVRELGDDLALKRIRELKARCEKLEKALEKAAANFRGYGFHATADATKEALNQSPE